MFVLPLVVVAAVVFAAYRVAHRGAPRVAAVGVDLDSHPVQHLPFWPSTVEGKVGVAAFVLGFLVVALVNVVQVAFLGWGVQVAALAFTAVARFGRHDRSASVLIVLVVTAVAVLASLLFLAGEVWLGHD